MNVNGHQSVSTDDRVRLQASPPRAHGEARSAAPRRSGTVHYPFSAIVAQEEMKRALLIAAVDPTVGGVLVFGDRGTGKSTAIRALAALLPKMRTSKGCIYNCAPQEQVEACEVC